jgi:hypothetical protein
MNRVTVLANAGSTKRTPTPSYPASRIIRSCSSSCYSAPSGRRRSIAQSDCRMRNCCAIAYALAAVGIGAAETTPISSDTMSFRNVSGPHQTANAVMPDSTMM